MTDSFADRLAGVQAQIAEAAQKAGRSLDEITLVAVSKTHSPEAVTEALAAGQAVFGESRVQEAKAKIPLISSRARWQFIGHLQKNKIRQALPLFELFHGLDSLELARDFDRIAGELGLHPKVLLEVNVAGEATKFGFRPDRLQAEVEGLLELKRVQIIGLMTIAPYAPEPADSRPYFAALRSLQDELQSDYGIGLPELSMGMSGDFGIAVEEGATLVRVGTVLFGSRVGKGWRPASDGGTTEE